MAERLIPRKLDLEVRGSSLARRVVSLDKELYSTLSLFTQVYKWVPAAYRLGVTLRWTSIPPRGISNTPRHASCYGNRYKLRPFGPLARVRLYLTYVLSSTEILTAFIPRGVFSGGAWNILTNVGRNLSIKS